VNISEYIVVEGSLDRVRRHQTQARARAMRRHPSPNYNLAHDRFYVNARPIQVREVRIAWIEDKCQISTRQDNPVKPLSLD
jgi:hypothetical protein